MSMTPLVHLLYNRMLMKSQFGCRYCRNCSFIFMYFSCSVFVKKTKASLFRSKATTSKPSPWIQQRQLRLRCRYKSESWQQLYIYHSWTSILQTSTMVMDTLRPILRTNPNICIRIYQTQETKTVFKYATLNELFRNFVNSPRSWWLKITCESTFNKHLWYPLHHQIFHYHYLARIINTYI